MHCFLLEVDCRYKSLRSEDLPASILGQCRVVIVNQPRLWREHHILKYRAESNCIEDVRLFFRGQTNGLRITLSSVSANQCHKNPFQEPTPPSILKTPRSLQQCSSSPIKARFGSADKVVFPVPDRPKKTVTSPSLPSLADEWSVKTLCFTGIS